MRPPTAAGCRGPHRGASRAALLRDLRDGPLSPTLFPPPRCLRKPLWQVPHWTGDARTTGPWECSFRGTGTLSCSWVFFLEVGVPRLHLCLIHIETGPRIVAQLGLWFVIPLPQPPEQLRWLALDSRKPQPTPSSQQSR